MFGEVRLDLRDKHTEHLADYVCIRSEVRLDLLRAVIRNNCLFETRESNKKNGKAKRGGKRLVAFLSR